MDIDMISAGNVIGYGDKDPALYPQTNNVEEFNRRVVNIPEYGYNSILATIENFKQQHSYEFSPLEEIDSIAMFGKKGECGHHDPEPKVIEAPSDKDVASVMDLLKDSILQG